MSEHIVKSFTEQLEALANSVAQMGGLAEAQFANAIEAIAKRDGKLAETAIGTDDRVDRIQQTIEDQALKLLALRQPMAVDLRTTLAAIKIAYELERIGDLAKNIAKRVIVLDTDFLPHKVIRGVEGSRGSRYARSTQSRRSVTPLTVSELAASCNRGYDS